MNKEVQLTVCLDVSCHTVDNVSHRFARVGLVGVVIDNGSLVDSTVGTERPETLVLRTY
jgi:hypothetical protein